MLRKINEIYHYTFGTWAKSFRDMRWFLSDFFIQNCNPRLQRKSFKKANLLIWSTFHHLQKFSRKILDFAKNPHCCQHLILRIQGNILRNFLKKNSLMTVFNLWPKFFGIMAKTFRAFFKTELRASGWWIWWKDFQFP